jgi:hypothetical protein
MLDRRDDDMAVQTRLSADLPYHPGPVASLADLSLDELRFLRSCYERWYELSPLKLPPSSEPRASSLPISFKEAMTPLTKSPS